MALFTNLAAIVLAAGFSRRMGGENKLLKPLYGKPLVAHALAGLAELGLARLVVVLGQSADDITPLLPPSATVARNPRASEGMGASLAAGAAQLMPPLAGVFVVLGDMPFVTRADYEKLATAFRQAGDDAICVPLHQGQRGHPVLFAARYFPALAALHGDSGARGLLASSQARLREVEGCSAGILTDFDDPTSFAAYAASGP